MCFCSESEVSIWSLARWSPDNAQLRAEVVAKLEMEHRTTYR